MLKLKLLLVMIPFTFCIELLGKNLSTLMGIQTSIRQENNINIPTIGLKYGLQEQNWRTLIGINFGRVSNISYYNMVLDIDKGIFNSFLKNSPIKPYVGLSFSLINNIGIKKDKTIKDLGYGYGGKIGLVYIASNKIDIDLAYKYMLLEKLENSDNKSLNLSLHYFY